MTTDREHILTFVKDAIRNAAVIDSPPGYELHRLGIIDGLEQVEQFITKMGNHD